MFAKYKRRATRVAHSPIHESNPELGNRDTHKHRALHAALGLLITLPSSMNPRAFK